MNSNSFRSDSFVGGNDLRNGSLSTHHREKPRRALTGNNDSILEELVRSPLADAPATFAATRYQAVRHSTTRRKWGQWRPLNSQLASDGRPLSAITSYEIRDDESSGTFASRCTKQSQR